MGLDDFQRKLEKLEERRRLFERNIMNITCIRCDRANAGLCVNCSAPLCEVHKKVGDDGRIYCSSCHEGLFLRRK